MAAFDELKTVSYQPKGIVLVIPPWNFPLAIPVGGTVAALAGGNTVLLKPATVALPVAWEFAQCFWDAGVPKDALQVVCPAERQSLNWLSAHQSVKHIILTGGTDTAFRLLENAPRTPLSAETGGKNAMILTVNGDQDRAILNVVSSAFSNAGQKCSACSLLLVERSTYEDAIFQSKLRDAVLSLRTGGVWDPMNYVGPMIDHKNEKLQYAIDHLEPGESWLVAPEFIDKEGYILKPCVKWGVKPGSYTFRNELFAPLLSVVCIDSLEQGIEYANSSEYGLTAGLQSLNKAERELWKNKIEAGNLYINRGITGAIVRRQPFGGMKRSAFGGGIKAGGPNYVASFLRFKNATAYDIKDVEANYRQAWNNVFSKEEDVSHIYGEENTFRYLPLNSMALRIADADALNDALLVMLAANQTKTKLTVSLSDKHHQLEVIKAKVATFDGMKLRLESEEDFINTMSTYERVRACSEILSDAVYQKAAELGLCIIDSAPLAEGRIELLHYLKEQSISFEYHRYGSIFEENKCCG